MSQTRNIPAALAPRLARLAACLGLTMLLAAAAGCQQRQLADRMTSARLQSLSRTAHTFAQSEARRPQELYESLVYADGFFRNQATEFSRNLGETGRRAGEELDRARRNLVPYSNDALRIMYGKPEEIEENAIILFY